MAIIVSPAYFNDEVTETVTALCTVMIIPAIAVNNQMYSKIFAKRFIIVFMFLVC